MKLTRLLCCTALLVALALLAAPAQAQKAPLCPIDVNGRVASVHYEGSMVYWDPVVPYERIRLTVSTPCSQVVREFGPKDPLFFDLRDVVGEVDGNYTWELRIVPQVDKEVRYALAKSRLTGDMSLPLELQQKGLLPKGPMVDSAMFTVVRGEIVPPDMSEDRGAKVASSSSGGGGEDGLRTVTAAATVLTNGDGVIRNSLCVGFDCVNSPTFSDSTILLVENNTRIKFDDTSTISGFPNRDWELQANSSNSGGGSFFAINDCGSSSGGGCADDPVFIVEANAPSNALRIDNGGRVGFGTANPSVELHVVDGDTPTLRLQQDGSSGFAPQSWDVAGNETSFFVRDVTNGSTLPLRIRPGAPSSSIDIANGGNVGVGTGSPSASLHVRRTNGTAQVFVQEASSTGAGRTLFNLENNGQVKFRMKDAAQTPEWVFTASNAFQIDNLADVGVEFQINPNGEILQNGSQIHAPDYVFEPDYGLMTLEQLGSFVAENKHLPNVPNAEDIRTNGLNLTQFPMRLLEKIEELTLYTLEQQKQLAALAAQNEELRKAVDALRNPPE